MSRHVLANWIDDSHQPARQVLGVTRWAGRGGWGGWGVWGGWGPRRVGGWGVWVGGVPGMEGNPLKRMEIHEIYGNP